MIVLCNQSNFWRWFLHSTNKCFPKSFKIKRFTTNRFVFSPSVELTDWLADWLTDWLTGGSTIWWEISFSPYEFMCVTKLFRCQMYRLHTLTLFHHRMILKFYLRCAHRALSSRSNSKLILIDWIRQLLAHRAIQFLVQLIALLLLIRCQNTLTTSRIGIFSSYYCF